jgi:hypothetical protein
MGKTRLAIEVAGRLDGDSAEAAHFVALAALTDESFLVQEVASRLGAPERRGEQLAETLAAHVGDRSLRLVLDNCEHLVAACAQLVETLLRGCPNLRVLTTSLQPLRVPGEVVWRIAPLTLPGRRQDLNRRPAGGSEAVRLFEDRARQVRPGFAVGATNADAVAHVVRRLEGIPLAIELAGGARTEATSPARVIDAFAWSEDGALAYVAHSSAPTSGSRLVIRPSRGAASAVALPPAVGGPTPILRFSPDGRLLLLVDAALAAGGASQGTLQVRRLDGSLLFQATAASEATWAGSRRVYFMDARGVNVADLAAGTTRTILPGARWRAPDTSPDGRTVVFELAGARGVPRLELVDTSTDAVLPGFERDGGTTPRFVSPTDIWFHEMGGDAIVCLDLERRTETPTGLTGIVTDVRQVAAR